MVISPSRLSTNNPASRQPVDIKEKVANMSNEGNVSTVDTPKDRPINVVTSESDPQSKEVTPPAASSTDDQTSGKSAESDKNSNDEGKKTKRSSKSKRRIGQLTRENTELRTAADKAITLQSDLDAANAEIANLKQSSHSQQKPKRSDFDNDDAFGEAFSTWKSESSPAPKAKEAPPKANQPPPPNAELQEINEAGNERHEDFDLAMDPRSGASINEPMADYLFDLGDPEMASDVIMHLFENKNEANELFLESKFSASKAVRGMDKIVELVKSEAKGKKPEPEKKGSKTPPPAPPNHESTGNPAPMANGGITGDEGMDSYAAKRRAQEKNLHRR